MIKALLSRLQQGHQTMRFPRGAAPPLSERFRGLPEFISPTTAADAAACPVGALQAGCKSLDMGRCLFCADCPAAAHGSLRYTQQYRLAVRKREDLIVRDTAPADFLPLEGVIRRLLGRSLKLRQVSAGGCSACEADTNVLGTIGWDLGRFGIQFVASPRHADGLLITGAVSTNMKLALEKTYQAVPSPKIVIAVGACAIAGGPYIDHPEVCNGVDGSIGGSPPEGPVPVDLYVPGCPPNPLTILDGLLRLLGRIR